MDIAAWRNLSINEPGKRAETWHSALTKLSPEQRRAVWAWHNPSVDQHLERSNQGDLAGVPFAAKDLFHVADVPTLAGGSLPQRPARRTSGLIQKLESHGAVLVAKTHLHEFAYGLTGENPHYGHVEHPHFVGHSSGGSSSGSAAAVASGAVPFALGTDTAGSLRVPASYCGLFSWRGQPHESAIKDVFPLAPSFDTAGWMTTTAADCAQIWRLLHSARENSGTSFRGAYLPAPALNLEGPSENLHRLNTIAAKITDLELDESDSLAVACRDVHATYSILQSTEAFMIHQSDLDRRRDAYGRPVWQRIDRGRRWTARQMDRARLHALKIRSAYSRFFETYDYLVTPVCLHPSPRTNDNSDTLRDNLLKLNTHVSIAGKPALSLPVPLPGGFTLGLQVIFSNSESPAIPKVFKRCESC